MEDVQRLRRRVPPRAVIVSSDYRRARDTATCLGTPLLDTRLREVERPQTENFERAMARYLAGESVSGWEPRDEVVGRIRAVIEEFGVDAVYVGHGTAFTLYLTAAVRDLDAVTFWSGLRSPDVWQLGTELTRLI
jgi:broad specificity phosphatase PhoE